MSWYIEEDGIIVTDEEFQDGCSECMSYCSVGAITVPCNGESYDCPYYKEVDTFEYDKKIRNKTIEEFAEKCNQKITEFILEHQQQLTFASGVSVAWNIIDEIADNMKEEIR